MANIIMSIIDLRLILDFKVEPAHIYVYFQFVILSVL